MPMKTSGSTRRLSRWIRRLRWNRLGLNSRRCFHQSYRLNCDCWRNYRSSLFRMSRRIGRTRRAVAIERIPLRP